MKTVKAAIGVIVAIVQYMPVAALVFLLKIEDKIKEKLKDNASHP